MGAFDELHTIRPQMLADGYLARAVHGERLTFAVVEAEPGATLPEHRHDNEQFGMVGEGSVIFRVGDEERHLIAGVDDLREGGSGVVAGDAGDRSAVRAALGSGYRHIDTAAAYGNERQVGEAVRSFAERGGDDETVRTQLYPALCDILDWHIRGTRYGIGVDADGLLECGAPGVQLTWMDAKVGDWVVTPRAGKPVEVQALWFNAVSIIEELARRFNDASRAASCEALLSKIRASFLARFWNAERNCLYDVVNRDTSDGSLRPNQVFAISLPHPLVEGATAAAILAAVERELLTPYGLRTLAPGEPSYRGRYEGDVVSRDSAYHQGTVWPWLIGPYIDAYLRVHRGGEEHCRALLAPLMASLDEAGVGQISEIYDGDPPHTPRGCIAQAWSVAEVLRAARKTGFR